MSVEELLEELEDLIENATGLAFTGKCIVDADKIKTLIEDIRLNTPQEIKQAKAIVNDRLNILDAAKKEAELTIQKAQKQARVLVSKDEITKTAQKEATELLGEAQKQSNEMVRTAQARAKEMSFAASSFADDMLRQVDECLAENLSQVRHVRQNLKSASVAHSPAANSSSLEPEGEPEE